MDEIKSDSKNSATDAANAANAMGVTDETRATNAAGVTDETRVADAAGVMDVKDVVAWEQRIARSGTPLAELMVRAGQAVASYANDLLFEGDPLQSFNDKFLIENIVDERKRAKAVVILCGSGNNGGDGWVAAQALGVQGYEVVLVSRVSAHELSAEPARTNALETATSDAFKIMLDPNAEELAGLLESADLIIDAILGIGFVHDTVRAPYDEWIRLANDARTKGSAQILAVDCPSGLDAQTGTPAADCIKADLTVTMLAVKTGLVQPAAQPFVGDVEVARLDV